MAAPATPLPPLAVTMGEPAGIGSELAAMAWAQRHQRTVPPFFLIDDPEHLSAAAKAANIDISIVEISQPSKAAGCFQSALPVLPLSLDSPVLPGQPQAGHAPAVIEAIRRGTTCVIDGEAAAVVTNPVQKATLYEAGFSHPGHTEFLADLCHSGTAPVMMLASPRLRTVPVTTHLALAEAIATLTIDRIVSQGGLVAEALERDFGCVPPRLSVAGLNPHAGEAGAMGRQELEIIAPAVQRLQEMGIDAQGPHPADTMFHSDARARYDAALCMYHDQALIPLKTLDFDTGVNITLGLPIVRTSPDHGTALNLAGTGRASPASFIYALETAAAIAERRAGIPAAPRR